MERISKKILERKVDSAVRGDMMGQRNLYEAEAEVEARNWEREIPTLLFRRSIKNLNLIDVNYTKQVDEQIRLEETTSVCMENWN